MAGLISDEESHDLLDKNYCLELKNAAGHHPEAVTPSTAGEAQLMLQDGQRVSMEQ